MLKRVVVKKKLLEYLLQNVPLLYWAGVGEDEESDTDTTIKQKKDFKNSKYIYTIFQTFSLSFEYLLLWLDLTHL